jgi:hypothetical protein
MEYSKKEYYWRRRNAATTLFDLARQSIPNLEKLQRKLERINSRNLDRSRRIRYKCTYAVRNNPEENKTIDFESQENGSYMDSWWRSYPFNLDLVKEGDDGDDGVDGDDGDDGDEGDGDEGDGDEGDGDEGDGDSGDDEEDKLDDGGDPPLPGRPITVLLKPYETQFQPMKECVRCIYPECRDDPLNIFNREVVFLFCRKHCSLSSVEMVERFVNENKEIPDLLLRKMVEDHLVFLKDRIEESYRHAIRFEKEPEEQPSETIEVSVVHYNQETDEETETIVYVDLVKVEKIET